MIILGINHRCNFNCLFCLDKHDRKQPVPSYDELEKLFLKISKTGVKDIMLMKGESLIRSDFFKILKCARGFGLNVKITTNGSMLSYNDFFKRVVDGGVSQINLSIHSHIPKIANAIARNNQCQRLQKQALRNINAYMKNRTRAQKQLKLNINIVITDRHLDGLTLYLKRNLSFALFRIKYKIMERGGMDFAFYKKFLPSLFDIKPYIFKYIEILESAHIEKKIAFVGFPLCFLPS